MSDLSPELEVTIGRYLQEYTTKLEGRRAARSKEIQQWLGMSAVGVAAAVIGAFVAIRDSAKEYATKIAVDTAKAEVKLLQSGQEGFVAVVKQTNEHVAAAAAGALNAAAFAKTNAERVEAEIKTLQHALVEAEDDYKKLKKELVKRQNDLDAEKAAVDERRMQYEGVATSIVELEKKVGGDVQGKADRIRELLNAADAGSLSRELLPRLGQVESNLEKYQCPPGTIIAYAGNEIPSGNWLPCDGAAKSRTEFKALWDAIGDTWGRGDGQTTFTLPDLRGRFLRGVDDGAGVDADAATRSPSAPGARSGDAVGTIQMDATALPKSPFKTTYNGMHAHLIARAAASGSGTGLFGARGDGFDTSESAGGHRHDLDGGDKETRPNNAAVRWFIRY